MKILKKNIGLLFLFFVIIIFSWQFFRQGKIPLPADTIVGLYHPFRDITWDGLTSGVPFKNFLITDAVRQQYPWREQAVSMLSRGVLPLWNPYSFSGTPLFANLQSAVLNPLNLLFILLPFSFAWGVQVILQLVLGATFLYFFLKNLKLKEEGIVLACLAWIFSGFFVAWFEWNTILYAGIWLPLILLAKDKIITNFKDGHFKLSFILTSRIYKWVIVLVIAESMAFFAGHLQTFFYVVIVSSIYLKLRFISVTKDRDKILSLSLIFFLTGIISLLLMSVQLFPTLELILNSARSFDQPLGFRFDWYLPWKHLAQMVIPDFFGNPSTLNYWGEWNYGEFVSYIGIIPLFFSLLAIFHRRDKKTYFFAGMFMLSLLLALPNPISFLPYLLKIPFISSTAPSRLIFVTDFSLVLLCAFGVDYFLRVKSKKILITPTVLLCLVFLIVWLMVLVPGAFHFSEEIVKNLQVTKRNLILPSLLFLSSIGILFSAKLCKKEKVAVFLLILLTIFDLLRFSQKFNPFVKKEWIFPQTKITEFLQKQEKPFRIAATDSRIFPPNFSTHYQLETIEGYDPLYSLSYAEYWASVKRNAPDISSFNFNRIITPQTINSPFVDLLNTKYFLSFDEHQEVFLKKVYSEGQTKVYENLNSFPRAFMVGEVLPVKNKNEAINKLFENKNNLRKVAVVEENITVPFQKSAEFAAEVNIGQYSEQKIVIETRANNPGFLVVGNTFYPGWKATVDGVKTKIIKTDYVLQGVMVPAGSHEIVFTFLPLSFLIGLTSSVLGIVLLLLWGGAVWLKK